MITKNLVKLTNLLNAENEILKNDLHVYQETFKAILDLKQVEMGGVHLVSMDQIVKICQNNFKLLSSKSKGDKK